MQKINLDELEIAYGADDPDGYRVGHNRFGPQIGASAMGATVYELNEGQSICPYHYEYPDEEWLLVVGGRVTVRHEGGETELSSGDMVCFPPGPEGAHKVTCLGDETARVVMLSTKEKPAVAVYPDSGKIGIWPGDERDVLMMRRDKLAYYDGEA